MTATATEVTYALKPGSRLPAKAAQAIGEELDRISEKNGGELSAARVVAEARRKSSPIHPFFEWDDPKAANLWREHQARHLMNCVVVVVKAEGSEEAQSLRAFHVVSVEAEEDEESSRAYVPIARVAKDPAMAEQVIGQAKADLKVWKDRYEAYRTVIPEFGRTFEPVFRIAAD